MKRVRGKILQGECISLMNDLPAASVDMVFADPPYNLQLTGTLTRPDTSKVAGVDDGWDRFGSFAAYDDFTRGWLSGCRRLMKPDASLWVIGSYHNIFRIGAMMQDLGFWLLNDIIWRKTNPMPNFRGRRFTNAHETLIWAARDEKSRYTFNYAALKTANDDLQMRSDDWHFALCTGGERLRDAKGAKLHSTQKPEALVRRTIMAASKIGDTIFDPFMGTGTSAAAAKSLGRDYLGIERDPAYIGAARKRIAAVRRVREEDLHITANGRDAARIPFGSLVERRLIAPGAFLYDSAGKSKARVRADGSLFHEGKTGSIHALGARLQARPACNGWTFWHIRTGGKLVAIDELRQQLRAELSGVMN